MAKSSKKKEKVNTELKKLKLPYLKLVNDKTNLVLENLYKILPIYFNKNFLEYNDSTNKIELKTSDFKKYTGNVPILYSPCLKYTTAANLDDLQTYLKELCTSVRYIFDMPKQEQFLETVIDSIDQPEPEFKLKYFRYKKLLRLKSFNNLIVDFFLMLLHEYYYINFANREENVHPVDHYIGRIIPIVQRLYQDLMAEINYEFPADEIESNMWKF